MYINSQDILQYQINKITFDCKFHFTYYMKTVNSDLLNNQQIVILNQHFFKNVKNFQEEKLSIRNKLFRFIAPKPMNFPLSPNGKFCRQRFQAVGEFFPVVKGCFRL